MEANLPPDDREAAPTDLGPVRTLGGEVVSALVLVGRFEALVGLADAADVVGALLELVLGSALLGGWWCGEPP
jgi:hypothetical protein